MTFIAENPSNIVLLYLFYKNKRPRGLDDLLDHLTAETSIDYTGNVQLM